MHGGPPLWGAPEGPPAEVDPNVDPDVARGGPRVPDWALGLAPRRAPTGPNSWLQRWALINNEKKCPAKETPGRSLKITRRILTFI